MLKKYILPFIAFIMGFSLVSAPVFAEGSSGTDISSCRTFLGMVAWDCGIATTSDGSIAVSSESDLKNAILQIAMNVLSDISVIAAYLVLGYVIYGGYLYIFSSGDASKVASGKKTLTNAFIGLAIVMSATAIFGAIRIAIANGNNTSIGNYAGQDVVIANVDPGTMVEGLISWFVGVAGLVSAIFVVYGGIAYVTSSGDPSKLQKAKQIITYALIGLAICGLAELITAFVGGIIHDANSTSYINETIISKEVYEKEIY